MDNTGFAPLTAAVRAALRGLHKALVDAERDEYVRMRGHDIDPAGLLKLLISDAQFEWLRRISELIVELDDLDAKVGASSAEYAADVRAVVESLMGPRPSADSHFQERLSELIQLSPAVAIALADTRAALNRLPDSGSATSSEELHERHRTAASRIARRH